MVRIDFFPIDIGHKVINNKTYAQLFGRTVNAEGKFGQQILVLDEFAPYFLAQLKDNESLDFFVRKVESLRARASESEEPRKLVISSEIVSRDMGKEIKFVKVSSAIPSDLDIVYEVVKDWPELQNIFEYDVSLSRKYLVDKGVIPMVLTSVEGEEEKGKDTKDAINSKVFVLRAKEITQQSTQVIEHPRIISFDIETYNPLGKAILPEENPIIMAALAGDGFQKVITWKRFKTDNKSIIFVDSEADLILKIKQIIEDFKPDIIAGYYSDGFDFPYLQTRAAKHKIKLDFGLDYSEMIVNRRAETSSVMIPGIAHLDVLRFIRRAMGQSLDTESFRLENVAQELLGEGKDDINIENLAVAWDGNTDELDDFAKYNLKDAILTLKLAHKIMPNILELVKIVGIPLFDVNRSGFSQLVEWLLIRQSRQYNQLVPNKPSYQEISKRRNQTFTGAFVYEPTPGLYSDIVVYDFRSLYPSLITSHNLAPSTLKCDCCRDDAQYVPFEQDKMWFCRKKKGFVPRIIEDLISRRSRIKEMIKDEKKEAEKHGQQFTRNPLLEARQNSLKLLANSFYGYLGFFAARWYSIESAKATTAYGRHYITMVIEEAKKAGFKVLYSDTDSIFLSLGAKTKEDSKRFAEWINMKLPGIMELEFEGYYPKGLFVFTKESAKEAEALGSSTAGNFSGGVGAKKKYALLAEDGTVKIKGFETVRRNWSFIAKETQENIINLVLKESNKEKPLEYARDVIKDLKENKIPVEKVIIKTQLTKDISAYDSVGPHVAVAQRMQARGIPVGAGSMIKYVIVRGEGIIRERARLPDEIGQQDYDPVYYINNQIIPGVERILNVIGFTKDDLMKTGQQKDLSSFFGKKK